MNKQKKNGTKCHVILYFIFIFYLEPKVRKQLNGNDSRHYYANFFESDILKLLDPNYAQSSFKAITRHFDNVI